MYPMYGWTDSHPHPRNQMVYAPFHTRSFEPVPPHMKIDPVRAAIFEPWPYGSSYGYSCPPIECHGCCNHNYFPSHYNFRPHYPHFSPPPHSYHGNYPPFFGDYPGYRIPPPHFSVEQPRYDYDKGFPNDQHCCRCSNHLCKREFDENENENVKIEEQKMDMDMDKKSSGSMVPLHLRNFPFPFAMIPPGNLVDTEGSKSAKSEGKEDKKINHEMECDENSISSHEKETHSQQDIQSQLPFPLFWLPYRPEEVEKDDLKGMNSGQKALITPFHENKDEVKIPSSETGSKVIGNGASQKEIQVKKMEQVEEKKKDEERKVKSVPVVQANDNQDNGSTRNSAKKESSTSKSSKLPPVCLRVDPPKAKKVNGSSRSPSPPAVKGRSSQSTNENSKSLGQNEQSQSEIEKRSIKVIEGTTEGKIEAQTNNHVPPSHEEVPSKKSSVEEVLGVVNQDVGEATESEKAKLEGQLINKGEAVKVTKKMMSDSEAAVTIQSVYRGYEVRKSEPLKKLRQIAEIAQKMLEVKSRISTLDACSDVEIDKKQLVAIGETILGLLLKLDTIQGLHSSVREIRKSVAKELVSLQEKLDSLTTGKARVPIGPPSSKTSEGPTAIVTDNVSVESNQNEAEVILDSIQCNGIDSDAQSGNNPAVNGISGPEHVEVNGISGPEHVEMSELIDVREFGNNTSELAQVSSSVDPQRPDLDQDMEQGNQKCQVVNNGDGKMTTLNEESLELEVIGSISLPQVIVETTETTGDDPVVENIKVNEATENRTVGMDELENVDGKEEEKEAADNVSDMGGVKTEREFSTPVHEKVATDSGDNLKEVNITSERVPKVVEDGAEQNAHLRPEEHSEKGLPLLTERVDQVEGPGQINMEKGGEMVMEENKRLKEMMEKLIEAGNEQLVTITKLSGKVKDLEKKLSKNNKLKTKKKPRGKRQDMVLV